MRLLIVQTNYPGFLSDFYRKRPGWEKWSYSKLSSEKANSAFGSADFYSHSIRKLGHWAMEVVADDFNQQKKWSAENGFNLAQNKLWQSTRWLPAIIRNKIANNNWVYDVLSAQIKLYRPDVVYVHDLHTYDKAYLDSIRRKVRLVVGQIAYPLPPKENLYGYDLILSSFPHYVDKFKRMGIDSARLNWCFEPRINRHLKKTRDSYDVTFVGGFSVHHSKGNDFLEKLAKKTKVDFWGYGVNQLKPGSAIRKSYHGELWGIDMYQVFSQSKIVVNRHINISGQYANNMRLFEATGVGAMLLTDYKPNIEEFFRVDKEIVTYKDTEELIAKSRYYLKHQHRLDEISRAGKKRTLRDHNYRKRMKELMEILKFRIGR